MPAALSISTRPVNVLTPPLPYQFGSSPFPLQGGHLHVRVGVEELDEEELEELLEEEELEDDEEELEKDDEPDDELLEEEEELMTKTTDKALESSREQRTVPTPLASPRYIRLPNLEHREGETCRALSVTVGELCR
jgi:hypothetical protein